MMKTFIYIFIALLIFLSQDLSAQNKADKSNCNEKLLYKLINRQIRIINRKMIGKHYFIDFEVLLINGRNNGDYEAVCDSITIWDKSKLKKIKIKRQIKDLDSVKSFDYYTSLGVPMLNKSRNKCKIYIRANSIEYGFNKVYTFRKIIGIWVKTNEDLIFRY